jgi:diguanylate cyclase (GGDEF)-like protein/PAS domain S-box-containing protein
MIGVIGDLFPTALLSQNLSLTSAALRRPDINVKSVPDGRALNALSALDGASISILVTDRPHCGNPIAYANTAFTTLTGYTEAEVVGRNCRFLQGQGTDPHVVAEIRDALAAGTAIRREILNYRKDGTAFWNDLRIDPLHDAAGMLTGFVSIQSEADAVHRAIEAKEEAESRLDNISCHIPGYIYQRVLRTNGTIEIVYCSPSANNLLGMPGADIARTFYSHVHPDDLGALTAAVRKSAADMSIFREEFRLIAANGAVHWMRSDAPPRLLPNGEVVWDGLAVEISAEKQWQSEIADLALRDPLTGLLSREAWRRALVMHLASASDDANQCGVFYANIDAFRELNDEFGQGICDEILQRIAQRLSASAGSVAGVAGRLAGDEFAVLVPGMSDQRAATDFASALAAALEIPLEISAQLLTIRASIGASLHTGLVAAGGDVANELMTQAELALRWAKQVGQGGYAIYSAEQDDRFRNQVVLARSLERAIADDELELHYQPLVELASGRIVSAEALVRWKHPTLGMQRPDLFIPLAEASGLIVPLGRWVIDRAMRQRTIWEHAGLTPPPIAINVSGLQLLDTGFVPFVVDALKSTQSRGENFELELTEGQLIEASPQIIASLHALRDLGFKIAIDDFGSGHASFRYLRDFPVDKLKIDQLFVRKLVLESSDALIIRAIISLARSMGIQVVAEGVETDMQREFLLREGCEVAQGYLFSMPLVAEDFAWMLAGDVRLPLSARERKAGRSSIRSGPAKEALT